MISVEIYSNKIVAQLYIKGTLHGELILQQIDLDAYAMSIHINDAYQKQGWSKKLFLELFSVAKLDPNTILAIDADASDGFWDHLGCLPHRYGYDYTGRRLCSARGYEKSTTVRCLYNKLT